MGIMSSVPGSIIHDVINPPITTLQYESSAIECKDEHENRILIFTYFTVQSRDDQQANIDDLFHVDGTFLNMSANLLSKLFGIRFNFEETSFEIKHSFEGIKEEIVIMIVLVAVCIIILTISYIIYRVRSLKLHENAMTIFIKRPMIIGVAIGIYDDWFPNLVGIEEDIKTYRDYLVIH